jgi:hypothetical protein
MARAKVHKVAFNRGLVSRLGMARADIKRLAFASAEHVNFMPRVLGSMMLRPGTRHLGSSNDDAQAFHIPFIFSADDKAIVELTASVMRVWLDDAVLTRPSVTTAVTNGTFDANVASWTDLDEGTASSVWVTGGYMGLTGYHPSSWAAIRRQQVSVTGANIGVEHALRVVIQRGPVTFKVGSSAGADDYVTETDLATGHHSLAFTPTGDFFIEFSNRTTNQKLVDSCTVEASGAVEIPAPWA